MMKGMTGQVDFGSHTDSVVAAAAALVNASTPGQRRGRAYVVPSGDALTHAVEDAVRPGRPVTAVTKRRVPAFIALARAVRPVFEDVQAGRMDKAAATVN